MPLPLMPKATTVWLIENTTLSFTQIAEFCGLHVLEVQGIADEEVAVGIKGKNPIASGELTSENISECENDVSKKLELQFTKIISSSRKKRKSPRYTPLSRRQDRPNAISWLLKFHPELSDSQISKLIGTTKSTITQIRERSHWNIQNVTQKDPIMLGLCSQNDLESVVIKARKSERWQDTALKDDNEISTGMKYGLISKEDYEKEMAETIELEDASELLKGIIEKEDD
ncbi:MAG: hypothetical protein CFH31_00968 [Alphaproteobacteria bacterium MarineAlpha9_Bin1]|nr:MAG: hypothetical protein CFH31_00968 [Alphaproteobacteria bacterium MarineAlpha9_Bin1]